MNKKLLKKNINFGLRNIFQVFENSLYIKKNAI